MSYWRCLILCCRRRVMRQRYQEFDFKYGIGTIYYPNQHIICIGTWEYNFIEIFHCTTYYGQIQVPLLMVITQRILLEIPDTLSQ